MKDMETKMKLSCTNNSKLKEQIVNLSHKCDNIIEEKTDIYTKFNKLNKDISNVMDSNLVDTYMRDHNIVYLDDSFEKKILNSFLQCIRSKLNNNCT